jgi:hypothetical protein
MLILNRYRLSIVIAICLISSAAFASLDFVGEYKGLYYADKVNTMDVTGYVVEEGTGHYRIKLAAKANEIIEEPIVVEIYGKEQEGGLVLSGSSNGGNWTGAIKDGHLTAATNYFDMRFDLQKIVRHSPTEGLKPPVGAVVLLSYEPNTPPDVNSSWNNPNWKGMDDGSMQVGSGDVDSIKHFGDMKLHLEFLCPFNPDNLGQARSNSGVMCLGRYDYEIQILDSFGLISTREDCGGLCPVARPKVNASLPPGIWQTYDITFRAPRKDEQGKVVELPRMTVLHNGIIIHDDIEVPAPGDTPTAGPIKLQCHGDPGKQVRYRNIWVVDLSKKTNN